MSYKGNDLELRTPYAPGGGEDADAQTSWSLPPELGRDGPIPVDHTVLACCNAAYDAAAFHAARDVRVEHLLYALTRVDAARDILEQHGVALAAIAARGRCRHRCRGAGRCRRPQGRARPPSWRMCCAAPRAAPGRTVCRLPCTT